MIINPAKNTLKPWQMTQKEWLIDVGYKPSQGSRVRENWIGTHEGEVRVAAQSRKPIPLGVLEDYPGLAKKREGKNMTLQKIYKTGEEHILYLRQVVRDLWVKQCDYDGIPVDTKFAVFSEGNPYQPYYDKVYTQLLEAMRDYSVFGYVGQRIK